MSHGSVKDVAYKNVELLQSLLAKQALIVLLEQQMYTQVSEELESRLEEELESARQAADDAATEVRELRDTEWRLEEELESARQAADDAVTDMWELRGKQPDVAPAPTTCRRKHRPKYLVGARSKSKPKAPAQAQEPKPQAPDENMTELISPSPARVKRKNNKVL